jgi:hypothetical protein
MPSQSSPPKTTSLVSPRSYGDCATPLRRNGLPAAALDFDTIVEAAVAGSAGAICTFDAHFYKPTVLSFCAGRGIQVMNDADLLKTLRRVV